MHFNSANTSRFNLTIAQLQHEDLRVIRFKLKEHLCDLFELKIEFISDSHTLDLSRLIHKAVRFSWLTEDNIQFANGIISSTACLDIGTRFARYAITIVPRIWLLNFRKGCRIFQNSSVPKIISTLFNDTGLVESEHYQWSTDRDYPPRQYCTQYNETEWQFISRLLSEEGIHFHFQHDPLRHLLVLGDSKTAFKRIELDPALVYNTRSGLNETQEHINSFGFEHQIISNISSVRDYNFKTPRRSLQGSARLAENSSLEDYHYPGLYRNESEAQFYATLKQQQHNVLKKTGQGKSNVQRLRAGQLFTLSEHPLKHQNIEQLLVTVTHFGEQLQSLDEDTPVSMENSQYYNDFTTIPGSTVFRAQQQQRNCLIHGQQYAFVTGPQGEELYLNEYGQIKVQFLWDREGQQDEKTSCWIRTDNEIAGKQWGHIMPPRTGQLVLVEFEQGNPDRPLISGRLYHGDSLPPYSLPQHKTRSTTKTHSTPDGQGYNEIRFEDKQSQEQIYFHAEKDQDIRCKNDKREFIANTRSLIVDNDKYEHIKKDQHQKVQQNLQQKIGTQLSEQIGDSKQLKVGQKFLQSAGSEIHIKSSSTILEAGTELTFKASGGFIKIDASGVTINGIQVNLNGGGSPGSATSAAPQTPTMAVAADNNKPGQTFKPIEPQQAYQLSEFDFSEIKSKSDNKPVKKQNKPDNNNQSVTKLITEDEPYEIVIATDRETIGQYLQKTYSNPQKVAETFKLLNPHLKNNTILPLQVIILPRQELLACPAIPEEIYQHIQEVETTLATLKKSETHELAYNYFDLFESIDQTAQFGSASVGIFSASLGKANEVINKTLKNIESAYIRHINNPEEFTKTEFYQFRQKQLATLKSPMGSLLMKQMGYNTDTNILRQLGLKEGKKKLSRSVKSSNSLPRYTKNLDRVARQAKILKSMGYLSIALDSYSSGYKIYEACTTGREDECSKLKYTETVKFTGSVIGGSFAGSAGAYFTCNILFGLESAGTSLLWCSLLAGGASAYAGGDLGGKGGEKLGSVIYEVLKND